MFSTNAAAHELTPTYPKFIPSVYPNILRTNMNLWNRREDVNFYEIAVFDKDWQSIPFATKEKIVKLSYLEHKSISIFIRKKDLLKIEYICTISKSSRDNVISTGVTSKICSRVK